MSKLSAKYQFCAIHTADTTDGKVHRIRESPSFIPARVTKIVDVIQLALPV